MLIQLGAILAIVALYFAKLWRVALGMFSNPDDRRFVIGVLVAFLPAVIIGLIAGKYIKDYLFNPWVVCFSLIVGGAILLWVDQLDLKPHEHDATQFPLLMYLWIGVAQCLAMIPGVSRSGATIVAAMLLGADKRAAAEFSFFLAIPTMVGAFAYDFYKNRGEMTMDHLGIVAIGFVVSFITAMIVVKTFLTYVTRHGFTLFAWWRVIVGTLGLIALALGKVRSLVPVRAGKAALWRRGPPSVHRDMVGTQALCPSTIPVTQLRALLLELAGGAETPEILRGDRFHRIRRDPEPFQRQAGGLCRVRHHIVRPQQRHLVRRQFQRARRELQEHAPGIWPGRTAATAACARRSVIAQDDFHDLAHGQHFRPAELVGRAFAWSCRRRHRQPRSRHRRHRPAAILVTPPPISGSTGDIRASAAKRLVNWSSGPNITDGRRMVAEGDGGQHGLFAGGLGAGVARRRFLVGADRRDMHHPRARPRWRPWPRRRRRWPARRQRSARRPRPGCRQD